jgi:hypothetical protein
MKSLRNILMPSLLLMVVMLMLYIKIGQSEVTTETIFPDPQVKHEINLVKHDGFRRSIRFEPNLGQTNISASFIAHGNGYQLFLSSSEAVLAYQNTANRIQLEGSNPCPQVKGYDELPSKTNYLIGNDPANWITDITNYARVEYMEVYPGINLVYYGNEGELEYDFIVAPGANPDDILLKFDKHNKPTIMKDGSLIISDKGAEIKLKAPFAYQENKGIRDSIFVEYTIINDSIVGFITGDYDPESTLVIDPVLVYSTYLGTNDAESGEAIAVDAQGCAYVTGETYSLNFPMKNCFQCFLDAGGLLCSDAFVTKFNAAGTDIVYSTYLGGSLDDSGSSIAVDANGRVYLTGRTSSKDNISTPKNEGFPLLNAYQAEIGSTNLSDAFVTVLSASGSSLIYSTYLGGGGEDYGTGIAVGDNRYVYVTGTNFSFDFPVKSAFMGTKPSYYFDAFVSKFDSYATDESSLIYSTHLGGNWDDYSNSIAVDGNGCAYVTGQTNATDFPLTSNAIQKSKKVNTDAFVTKFAPTGLTLVYSTYLGSDGRDEGLEIVVDAQGYAYVNGFAAADFPTSPGTFNPSNGYNFLCKILPDGNGFAFSTHTPSTGCLAVDVLGRAYLGNIGTTYAYLASFNPAGSDTLFTLKLTGDGSDYIKDIAVDKEHSIYITGVTTSTNIATAGAYKTSLSGTLDIMVAKFSNTITNISDDNKLMSVSGLHLYPIYPSPFNSQTAIRFKLPVQLKVTLGIFDIYGRKIMTLIDKPLSAGEYTEIWNCMDNSGDRVSPGVYICLLTDGTIKLSQKIVVTE